MLTPFRDYFETRNRTAKTWNWDHDDKRYALVQPIIDDVFTRANFRHEEKPAQNKNDMRNNALAMLNNLADAFINKLLSLARDSGLTKGDKTFELDVKEKTPAFKKYFESAFYNGFEPGTGLKHYINSSDNYQDAVDTLLSFIDLETMTTSLLQYLFDSINSKLATKA